MKIAIIGAMREEVAALIPLLQNHSTRPISPYEFHLGTLYHHEVVVVEGGVGKVMSGMLMASLLQNFIVDVIINLGVAGGLGNVKIGDVVVGEVCFYGDVDVSSGGHYQYGQMARCPRLFQGSPDLLAITKKLPAIHAAIMSNDRFATDRNELNNLIAKHFSDLEVRAVDMESAALAQGAYVMKVPYLAIRAISDVVGSENQTDEFQNHLDDACEKGHKFLLSLLEKI